MVGRIFNSINRKNRLHDLGFKGLMNYNMGSPSPVLCAIKRKIDFNIRIIFRKLLL